MNVVLTVDEALEVAFGPLRLFWDGEVDVGHVCSLEKGVTAIRALF